MSAGGHANIVLPAYKTCWWLLKHDLAHLLISATHSSFKVWQDLMPGLMWERHAMQYKSRGLARESGNFLNIIVWSGRWSNKAIDEDGHAWRIMGLCTVREGYKHRL